ncbi:acyl-CoA carboxylase subunit epsilon [Streptacidiphilus cavernicola]|uniref:Acyl-CoA carboxylase subunit epsilon n=1 Tax=Streptacidiphilus cavernicola TaxID=3342716 RepID=A0ABV6VR18_9ACTN
MTGKAAEPLFRVLSGRPTAEELAALTVVLLSCLGAEEGALGSRPRAPWPLSALLPAGSWNSPESWGAAA